MLKRLAALVMIAVLCPIAACMAQVTVEDVRTTVDFELLSQLNPECIAWLYQEESGLNRPVMQNKDDEYYHERGFDGTKIYKTGSAYMLWEDSLSDQVVVIRGQARTEGAFSVIPEWCEQEISDQRSPFRLLTPDGDYHAEVFACLSIEARDMADWYPPEDGAAFEAWADKVLEASLIEAGGAWPVAGDRMMFVAGLHLNGKCTLLMTTLDEIAYEAEAELPLIKRELDMAETVSGMKNAGPAGELMYYAQNDPLFAEMRYESAIRSGSYRDFGGGGCGPTAMAIIVANLVEKEQLPLLGQHAKSELGNLFCPCSVNRVYCDHTHVPYQLETPEEYLRYLPVAMGDFAAGNNEWDLVARRTKSQGTNIRFVEYVTQVYGLTMTPVGELAEALEIMRSNPGEGLVLISALAGSAMTNSSHFIVLTGVDDEYFYMFDPMYRTAEEYRKTDKKRVIDVVEPGVVRMRLSDSYRSDLTPVYYFTRGE
ncbi:MAG: hypothetical protein IKK75_02400 [Clostridia bacterium]|nr:hypothetical protein [Clostridia bacterium]